MTATAMSNDRSVDWDRMFYVFWALLALWRLIYLAIVPLELSADESYYWDWSRRLDWGYYSKPPLIAWINALSTGLLGNSNFTVRLPAALFSTAALWFVFALARRMFGSRVGFWSFILAAASPANCAVGFIMTIDAPLVCFWSLALYAFWTILESNRPEPEWELVYILACGLGILAKQMMMVFALLTILFVVVSKADRPRLRQPRFYLMTFLPMLFLLPTLWWNYRNQWITVQHTGHHFESHSWTILKGLSTFGEFVGTQLFVTSPIVFVLFVAMAICLLIGFKHNDRRVRYLLLFSAVPLLVFVFMSFRQRINPNWPAVFYMAGIVLLAAWGCGEIDCRGRLQSWRKLFVPGIVLGAVLTLFTYLLPFALPLLNLDGTKVDPVIRLRGWRDLTSQLESIREQLPDRENTIIISTRRQPASAMAFYLPDQPQVFQMPISSGRIRSQYDIWGGLEKKIGADALIVARQGDRIGENVSQAFDSVEKLATIDSHRGRHNVRRYDVYLGKNLKKLP